MWNMKCKGLYLLLAFALANEIKGQSDPLKQEFRLKPHNMQVLEGTDIMLRCEISNRVGDVQWTKDGFALGFSAVIPGYPRYSIIGDASIGEYNLQISNVTLDDNAEYQCQVGPAKGNSAIRAKAKLDVTVPPKTIRIEGYSQNAKIETEENQNLTLKCVVENSKPATEIVWYRGNIEFINPLEPEVNITETHMKTYTTTSTMTLLPTYSDDYKEFSCEAKHKALPPDIPLRASVQLSILHPPDTPVFKDYSNETLHPGQQMEITCISVNGNPPARLTWYKSGILLETHQKIVGRSSESTYTFLVQPSDDKANLTCEAENIVTKKKLITSMQLTVTFSPAELTVEGPKEAAVGDEVHLSCISSPSNPAAKIDWTVDGKETNSTNSAIIAQSKGGWISIANITLPVMKDKISISVVCRAFNQLFAEAVFATHTINILRAPSAPIVTGYDENEIITAGSIKKLICTSSGGSPPSTMSWFKNGKKLHSTSKMNGNTITSELIILTNASDNQAQYKCQVENTATTIPLFASKTLQVHFPPETVIIRSEPNVLKPGIMAKLICDSSSSNPPAVLSWWKEGIPVKGEHPTNRAGLWGGSVSSLELFVKVTREMHSIAYTCQSVNEVLKRSAHETIILNVLYPPEFLTTETVFTGIEGESLQIALTAEGNPMAMTFSWSKDGFPISLNSEQAFNHRISVQGATLNIKQLNRSDNGTYICKAKNSQGEATIKVDVIVEYAAGIKSVSTDNSFVPGEKAVISCSLIGEPLKVEHVHWSRPNYDIDGRAKISFNNNTLNLFIENVQKTDAGNFTCSVDNLRGEKASENVLLIVESAPKVDVSSVSTRFAATLGHRGELKCTAEGAPMPLFTWQRNGREIKLFQKDKYRTDEMEIDPLTTTSTLYIEHVTNDDFGLYECTAKNVHGESSVKIQLKKSSRPDTPKNLVAANLTSSSVELKWNSSFNGGLHAHYRIRYKKTSEKEYKYVETKADVLSTAITGLAADSAYLFSIMSVNEVGGSKYLPDIKVVTPQGNSLGTTSGESTENGEVSNWLVIVITAVLMTLLILNAALVACFVIRRLNKKSAANSQNGEAYSKNENNLNYENDNHKKAASTYLVENVDIIQSASFPPKYQESSLSTPPYTVSADYIKTLPNPKRRAKILNDTRSKDDHMLVSNGIYIPSPSPASSLVMKGSYISSPSPAPPPDGSYYNMGDKYLSYPPVV